MRQAGYCWSAASSGPTTHSSMRSSALTFSSALPSWEASSGASTWTQMTSCDVDRVVGEDRLAFLHQFDEQLGARPSGQVIGDGLVGHVMWRLGARLVRKVPVAVAADQGVTVLHAGVQFQPRTAHARED